MDLDKIKNYLNVDFDEDDLLIETFEDASKKYFKTSTGKVFNEDDSLHVVLVLMLIKHFYDNRASVSDKTKVEVPYTITELLKHIAFAIEAQNA